MAQIEFINVTKSFDKNTVIDGLNLTVKNGSFTVLVGPSGCGKTTLLRMIAGIGPQTSGKVLIDGMDVTNIPPGKRSVAMVFQNYAIYPTMSVRENIEFGLVNNKINKNEIKERVEKISAAVGLTEYLTRAPSTLSGGQRQRVALARAMVKNPAVFLMDEPLSNLDAKLRVQMRIELIELHKNLGTTFVYVTHDQVEAMSMADTIVLMNKGKIQQEASPKEIYQNPDNLFTSQFIGTPPMNVLPLASGQMYGFRPEKCVISKMPLNMFFNCRAVIVTREMLGSEIIYQARFNSHTVMIKTEKEDFSVDEPVYIGVQQESLFLYDAEEQRIRANHAGYESIMMQIKNYGENI